MRAGMIIGSLFLAVVFGWTQGKSQTTTPATDKPQPVRMCHLPTETSCATFPLKAKSHRDPECTAAQHHDRISGRVILTIVVGVDGKVSDIEVRLDPGHHLAAQAIR